MARTRSTPARRGPVRTARRRSRWEARPGPLALGLLVAMALLATVAGLSGGGDSATPVDTALPSRPAAGPDAGDGGPGEEAVPDVPEDVPAEPDDVPEDVPDTPKAPKRAAPAPKKPSSDVPAHQPADRPADRPREEPVPEGLPTDAAADERHRTSPGDSPDEVLPDGEALAAPYRDDVDAVPFTAGEPVGDGDVRDGRARYGRDHGVDRHRSRSAPADVVVPAATLTASAPREWRSHRAGSRTPTRFGDGGGDELRAPRSKAFGGQHRERHAAHHQGVRHPAAPDHAQPGHLVEHTGHGDGRYVVHPSGVDQLSDSHQPGFVTHVAE